MQKTGPMNFKTNITHMKKQVSVLLKLRIEVDATEKLVKAHNGKTVKVRSHYRRILGA